MHDVTYNSLRGLLKDNNTLAIRPSFEFPSRRGEFENLLDLNVPLKRFSAFGYNFALERRLNYAYTCCKFADKDI